MKNYNRKETDSVGRVYYYYLDNEFHRIDGPAIEFAGGDKHWFQNGQLHRTDGPAVEYTNGTKYWFQNGQMHRTDGPAIESPNGSKSWYYYGEKIDVSSQKEFDKHIKTLILK